MKNISKRIQMLVAMASNDYSEIWDLCCDHGIIGHEIASAYSPKKVHFIDQVSSIIEKLQNNLPVKQDVEFFASCMPCEIIKINPNEKNLIVLAGVGSETIIKALKNLKTQKLGNTDILISTHKHPHKLRMFLRSQNFSLIKESLVYEGGHFYEMLLVDSNGFNEISLVGDKMWNFHDVDHRKYCHLLLDYYEIKLRHGKIDIQNLFDELRQIKSRFKIPT